MNINTDNDDIELHFEVHIKAKATSSLDREIDQLANIGKKLQQVVRQKEQENLNKTTFE